MSVLIGDSVTTLPVTKLINYSPPLPVENGAPLVG